MAVLRHAVSTRRAQCCTARYVHIRLTPCDRDNLDICVPVCALSMLSIRSAIAVRVSATLALSHSFSCTSVYRFVNVCRHSLRYPLFHLFSIHLLTHSLIYLNIQPSNHLTIYLHNLNIHHTAEYIVTEQAKGSSSASFSPNPSHLGIAMAREAALYASPIFHSAPAAGEISLW